MSGTFPNIFANILEQQIVKQYLKNHKILYYVRFVDDFLLILRKHTQKEILQDFNNFDKYLNWPIEEIKKQKFGLFGTKCRTGIYEVPFFIFWKNLHNLPRSDDS